MPTDASYHFESSVAVKKSQKFDMECLALQRLPWFWLDAWMSAHGFHWVAGYQVVKSKSIYT